jgi:hypothetical protein
MIVSPLEAPHIFHKNGLAEPLSTPVSNTGVMFPESNFRTVSRDERLLSSVKQSNICQRDGMSGDVVIALDKQRTGEQISASSLSSRTAAEREALANTDEGVKNVLWVEFQIVDTGIGISGTSITYFSIIRDFSTFQMIHVNLVVEIVIKYLVCLYQISLCRNCNKPWIDFVQILDWLKPPYLLQN